MFFLNNHSFARNFFLSVRFVSWREREAKAKVKVKVNLFILTINSLQWIINSELHV